MSRHAGLTDEKTAGRCRGDKKSARIERGGVASRVDAKPGESPLGALSPELNHSMLTLVSSSSSSSSRRTPCYRTLWLDSPMATITSPRTESPAANIRVTSPPPPTLALPAPHRLTCLVRKFSLPRQPRLNAATAPPFATTTTSRISHHLNLNQEIYPDQPQ